MANQGGRNVGHMWHGNGRIISGAFGQFYVDLNEDISTADNV